MEQVDVSGVIKQMCCNIVGAAPEHFRIAFNESDDSTDKEPDADEFLKMDEIRLGRDFKLYGLMAKVAGHGRALADFADCFVVIQCTYPDTFVAIKDDVKGWSKYFPEEKKEEWINLWEK